MFIFGLFVCFINFCGFFLYSSYVILSQPQPHIQNPLPDSRHRATFPWPHTHSHTSPIPHHHCLPRMPINLTAMTGPLCYPVNFCCFWFLVFCFCLFVCFYFKKKLFLFYSSYVILSQPHPHPLTPPPHHDPLFTRNESSG